MRTSKVWCPFHPRESPPIHQIDIRTPHHIMNDTSGPQATTLLRNHFEKQHKVPSTHVLLVVVPTTRLPHRQICRHLRLCWAQVCPPRCARGPPRSCPCHRDPCMQGPGRDIPPTPTSGRAMQRRWDFLSRHPPGPWVAVAMGSSRRLHAHCTQCNARVFDDLGACTQRLYKKIAGYSVTTF